MRPLAAPVRPSQPNLAAAAAAALARPSSPNLPAAPAPQQPTAFEQLQGGDAVGPGFRGDLDAARAALFGEVPQREGAVAPPPAAPPPEQQQAPLPRPRPSRDLTEAAAQLAARIKATTSSPNLQPVVETKPFVPTRRALPWGMILGGVAVLGGLGTGVFLAMGHEDVEKPEAPVEAPPPVAPKEAPPPQPTSAQTLGVGGLRFSGVPAGAKLTVDGTVIGDPTGDNFFSKGIHNVVVEAKGLPRYERSIEVETGQVKEVAVDLKKPGSTKKK
jgi:hypothetical protein